MSVFVGRALKERSVLNNPDNFNESQVKVFNKRTKHDRLFISLIPLILVAFIIPILRYNTTNSFVETIIFTGVSYLISASVVVIEFNLYCIWDAEIRQSKEYYDEAKDSYQRSLNDALNLGKTLVKIDAEQDPLFKAFMSEYTLQIQQHKVDAIYKPKNEHKVFYHEE